MTPTPDEDPPLRAQGSAVEGKLRPRAEAPPFGDTAWRALVEATPGLIFATDAGGANVFVNARFAAYAGVPARDLLGDGWLRTLHPDDRDRAAAVWMSSVRTGEPYQAEYRFLRHDGEARLHLVRGAPQREGADGRIVGWVGTCIELEDRHEAEAANARLAAIVTSTSDAIISFAPEDGRIQTWNRGAERLFGYSTDEACGSPVGLLVPPDLPDGDATGVFAVAKSGERVHEYETWRITKSGERIPVSVTAARMIGVDGRLLGISAIFRDLRARREAEATLAKALAAKEALLAEVNHRVTNSLQLVSSLLSLQAARTRDPQLRQGLAEAQGRIGAVSSVHRRLYQSGTHGRIDDLGAFLRDLLTDTVAAIDPSGAVRFAAALPEAPLPTPIDRAVPLALAVSELVTNAVKYAYPAGRGGAVRLVLRPEPEGGLFAAVEDDGVGLPEGFDPAASGGVGMRVVLTLVRQLRGRLEIDAALPAGGATFRLRLPPPPPEAPDRIGDAA